MYSYEDRLRAVELYIRLGKRAGLTIRQLGYPTKNALRSWHREYKRRLELAAVMQSHDEGASVLEARLAVQHRDGRVAVQDVLVLGAAQWPARQR